MLGTRMLDPSEAASAHNVRFPGCVEKHGTPGVKIFSRTLCPSRCRARHYRIGEVEGAVVTGRRASMSASDSAWLRMEDPTNLMTVVAVMTFREPLDPDQLRRVIEDRLLVHDRFRQRALERPGRLGKPRWQDVDAFRLDDHFHVVELPE